MALTAESLKALGEGVAQAANEESWDMCECESSSWETCSSQAYDALSEVKKSDYTEVKSFARPPVGVIVVMFAARICLGEKIVLKGDVRSQSENGWKESKKLLADPSILKRFNNFDPSAIDAKMMAALKKIVEHPDPSFEFTYEDLAKKSRAVAAIARWVLAVYQFGQEQAL